MYDIELIRLKLTVNPNQRNTLIYVTDFWNVM